MLLVHHTVSLEESPEVVEALGRFAEVAGTVTLATGGLALEDGFIRVTEDIALPWERPTKPIASVQIALNTAWGVSLVVERGGEVVQRWRQWATS